MWKHFIGWYSLNKGLFWGMAIGLLISILFLTIGFWATLLIMICVGIGAFLGAHKKVRDGIVAYIEGLFARKRN